MCGRNVQQWMLFYWCSTNNSTKLKSVSAKFLMFEWLDNLNFLLKSVKKACRCLDFGKYDSIFVTIWKKLHNSIKQLNLSRLKNYPKSSQEVFSRVSLVFGRIENSNFFFEIYWPLASFLLQTDSDWFLHFLKNEDVFLKFW